jgi:hypothetical protein
MMTMVVKVGGLYGSDEHFYASWMFLKRNIMMQEYYDAFSCYCFEDVEPRTILGCINSTWGMLMKNK